LPDFLLTRSLFAILSLIVVFMLLFVRVFELQILRGNSNYLLSEENRLRLKRIQPERGIIYDREREVLAKNSPAFALGLDVTAVEQGKIPQLLQELNLLTSLPLAEAQNKVNWAIENGLQEVFVLRGLKRDTVLALETKSENLPGVYIDTAPVRNYVSSEAFAHVLGYTGEITVDELVEYASQQYQSGDLVGKTGLEKYYEEYLHGEVGKLLLERDARGKNLREVSSQKASRGDELYLTLKKSYQEVAYNALKEGIGKSKSSGGAVVVLKATSGEVLALASYPSFDSNIFNEVVSEDVYRQLTEDPGLPFLDRTISAVYPPASTFKLITATAALSEGVVTPETEINEVQSIFVGGSTFSNWTLSWGVAPHGPLDLTGALAQSSDIYFYEVGGGYENQKRCGDRKDRLLVAGIWFWGTYWD